MVWCSRVLVPACFRVGVKHVADPADSSGEEDCGKHGEKSRVPSSSPTRDDDFFSRKPSSESGDLRRVESFLDVPSVQSVLRICSPTICSYSLGSPRSFLASEAEVDSVDTGRLQELHLPTLPRRRVSWGYAGDTGATPTSFGACAGPDLAPRLSGHTAAGVAALTSASGLQSTREELDGVDAPPCRLKSWGGHVGSHCHSLGAGLEGELTVCEALLSVLEARAQRLQTKSSGGSGAEWARIRSKGLSLGRRLDNLAAEALNAGCIRTVPGAMIVFEGCSSGLERVAKIVYLCGEDSGVPLTRPLPATPFSSK